MMSELSRETVTAYASAKGGLKMLTRNLACEWAEHNIHVNGQILYVDGDILVYFSKQPI